MIYDLIIVGGGASGLACANIAKKRGIKFLVLESSTRAGRKILATGNGKCNLSNTTINIDCYNDAFVENTIKEYPTKKIIAFFESLGMRTKELEGRVYPYTESGSTVVNFLIDNIRDNIVNNYCVTSIEKQNNFIINNFYEAKNVLIATGSNATLGRSSLGLLDNFGHSHKPFIPSLVWLQTDTRYIKGLNGLRAKACVQLYDREELIAAEKGEVLFKDNGISGIAVFMLSTHIARRGSGDYHLILDFAFDISEEELRKYELEGIVRKPLAISITKQAKDKGKSITHTTKNFRLDIKGLADIKNAQVASGGYNLQEFEEESLQSKLIKNLYISGEVLNIDGKCGGYNLHWAWASGIKVGEHIYNK